MGPLSVEAISLPNKCSQMRRRVRAHLAKEIEEGLFAPSETTWATFDAAFTRRFAEAGFVGITWPKKYGGQERSFLERYVILEELLAYRAPVGSLWIAERQSGLQILKFAQAKVKERLLPLIAKGEISFGIGMSEPGSGSDLASVMTRATKTEGGWVLNGTKIWTTNGDKVDFLLVLARTGAPGESRHEGLTQFIVDMRDSDVEVRPIRDMTGGSDFCEIVMNDCFVDEEMMLGDPGEGWNIVTAELAFERSGPDRILSSYGLIQELVGEVKRTSSEIGIQCVGQIVGKLIALRQMSVGVAGMLEKGKNPNFEAAMVKDLGNKFEQEVSEISRAVLSSFLSKSNQDSFEVTLKNTILAAPSWTIRGGAREITRSIIAGELGLR